MPVPQRPALKSHLQVARFRTRHNQPHASEPRSPPYPAHCLSACLFDLASLSSNHQALQGIGFTEDRGASAVLECQGTYKYQHDTDKDLKFIHVFPRVDTSASEADASADAAAAAEASRAANPEWSCLTLGLDQFKKTVDKKVASFQQKQTLLRLLKAKAQQVQEFEERISNRGALNAEEQKLYENAVDLQDKARKRCAHKRRGMRCCLP